MKPVTTKAAKRDVKLITGHVQYLGPHIPQLVHYGALFTDGVFPHYYDWFAKCPALAEMFIPIADVGTVLRELSFDYAHNMRGTTGRHVTFYRTIQQWFAHNTQQKPQPSGVNLQHQHA